MAQHVSTPKPFASGDVSEWLQKFDICSRANKWTDEIKALKLPTLLEGEALAVWLEIPEAEQEDYKTIHEKLCDKLTPMSFVSLDEFHQRKLRPGEPLSVFVHDSKKLLEHAMPELKDSATRKQLLLHQFLAGLPQEVSRQLRAAGETKDLDTVVERARLLLALNEQDVSANKVAAVTNQSHEVEELKEQVTKLREQVAALAITPRNGAEKRQQLLKRMRCFSCSRIGHLQRDCPFRRQGFASRLCYSCGRPGHVARQCPAGNDQGVSVKGARYPYSQ